MRVEFKLAKLEPEIRLFHSEEKIAKAFRKMSGRMLDAGLSICDGFSITALHEGRLVALVYVRHGEDASLVDDYRILVHEATHAKQAIMEFFHEDAPSKEFEAIMMETLASELFRAHDRRLEKRRRKNRPL